MNNGMCVGGPFERQRMRHQSNRVTVPVSRFLGTTILVGGVPSELRFPRGEYRWDAERLEWLWIPPEQCIMDRALTGR
jgi:hypothetical protein